ncbi:MAG: hypothetical protein Q8Q15_04520 [bacterium]|nr:hypothetical protein [bacterium]
MPLAGVQAIAEMGLVIMGKTVPLVQIAAVVTTHHLRVLVMMEAFRTLTLPDPAVSRSVIWALITMMGLLEAILTVPMAAPTGLLI